MASTDPRRPLAVRAAPAVVTPLILLAAAVALRNPTATVQDAVVVSVDRAVCLRPVGSAQQVCFDAEHVTHLSLSLLRVGQCVRTTRTEPADAEIIAAAFTEITAAPTATCAGT